jgi:hypothetical protein
MAQSVGLNVFTFLSRLEMELFLEELSMLMVYACLENEISLLRLKSADHHTVPETLW